MGYKVFDTKTRSVINVNEKLDEEIPKPVIKNFERRNIYVRYKQEYSGRRFSWNGIVVFKE